jgi:hypothetical protein
MTQMPDINATNNTHMMQQQPQQQPQQQIHHHQQQLLEQQQLHAFNSPLQIIPTGQLCQMQPHHQQLHPQLQPGDMHNLLQSPSQSLHPGFQLMPEQHQVLYPYNMSYHQQQQPQHHQQNQQNMNHMQKPLNLPQLIVSPSSFSSPLIAVNTMHQQHPAAGGLTSPYILTAVAPMQQNFNTAISPTSTTPSSSSFNSSSPSTSNSPTNSRGNNNSNSNNQNVQLNGKHYYKV